MPSFKYIFFDVGNTLLFPNRGKILAPLSKDKHPDLGAWWLWSGARSMNSIKG